MPFCKTVVLSALTLLSFPLAGASYDCGDNTASHVCLGADPDASCPGENDASRWGAAIGAIGGVGAHAGGSETCTQGRGRSSHVHLFEAGAARDDASVGLRWEQGERRESGKTTTTCSTDASLSAGTSSETVGLGCLGAPPQPTRYLPST